jgi:hypothetical protein
VKIVLLALADLVMMTLSYRLKRRRRIESSSVQKMKTATTAHA